MGFSAWVFIVPRRPFYVSRTHTHTPSGFFGIHRASMSSQQAPLSPPMKAMLYLTGNGARKSVLQFYIVPGYV